MAYIYACCRALDDRETCEHKDRYLRAEAFIKSQGVRIGYAPVGVKKDYWKGGRAHPAENPPCIDIWPTAFEIDGWDRVTSTLIHEFGHCKLYEAEGICDGTVEAERKANEYGISYIPADLLPELYHDYRAFSLESYKNPGTVTTRDQFIEALSKWNEQHDGQRVRTAT